MFFLALVILLAVVWRVIFYFYHPENGFLQSYASPAKFDLMAIGILLYLAHEREKGFFSRHRLAGHFACWAGLAFTLFIYFGTRDNDRFAEIFAPEALGLGLFGFLAGGLSLKLFESRFWGLFSLPGKYCYGCYLLHPLIFFYAKPFLAGQNVFFVFFILSLVTTSAAALSYHLFEMPVNRRIRGAWGRVG